MSNKKITTFRAREHQTESLFLAVALVFLGGCSTTWINPSRPDLGQSQVADYESYCHSYAARSAPLPDFQPIDPQPSGTQTTTSCNGNGYNVSCDSVTTPYVSPADQNAAAIGDLLQIGDIFATAHAQKKIFSACMVQQGYITQSEYEKLYRPTNTASH